GDRERRDGAVVGGCVEPVGAGEPGEPVQDGAEDEPGDECGDHGADGDGGADIDPPPLQDDLGHVQYTATQRCQLGLPGGEVGQAGGGIADVVEQQVAGGGEDQQETDRERTPRETRDDREPGDREETAAAAFDRADDTADGRGGDHGHRRGEPGRDEGDQGGR